MCLLVDSFRTTFATKRTLDNRDEAPKSPAPKATRFGDRRAVSEIVHGTCAASADPLELQSARLGRVTPFGFLAPLIRPSTNRLPRAHWRGGRGMGNNSRTPGGPARASAGYMFLIHPALLFPIRTELLSFPCHMLLDVFRVFGDVSRTRVVHARFSPDGMFVSLHFSVLLFV